MTLIPRTWTRIALICSVLIVLLTSVSNDKEVHTADYYDVTVTRLFKEGNFSGGYKLLEEGVRAYPNATYLNKLMGQYYLQKRDYNKARYYLYHAIRDDNSNVDAKKMLVTVEELTKNYSSAICYINELLEVNPYWKGLWIKKMGIFRLQGNDVEADRILRRLVEVYPEDVDLKKKLAGRWEENLAQYRKNGNSKESIAALRQMINADPQQMENYLLLANYLLQAGQRDEALAVVSQGLSIQPTNQLLAEKRVGILTEQQRFGEAMDFVRSYQRMGGGGLSSTLTYLEEEAARAAVSNDPYIMYGRIYDRSKSSEALDFLLGTAVARGYTNDALQYIGEARKRQGDTPRLLQMEYDIYKQAGDRRKALPVLEKLAERQPNNADVIDELCTYRLEEGVDLMVGLDYVGALSRFTFVANKASDIELVKSAMNKKYTCLFESKQYVAAAALLDTLRSKYPENANFFARRTQLLVQQKKTLEALDFLEHILNDSVAEDNRAFYLNDYEEIALPYIKERLSAGATYDALKASERLLKLFPSSYYGLTYALTASSLLQKREDYNRYANMAVGYYPEDLKFKIRQADRYIQERTYAKALSELEPWFHRYPNDSSLIKAYTANSLLMATQLIKEHAADSALQVLNRGLRYDIDNHELLYAKGQAFEHLHQYDSAHYYLHYYSPSLLEYEDYKVHLSKVLQKGLRNELSLDYLQARFGDRDVITSVASASYTRKGKRDNFTATLNYAGRDGKAAGEDADTYTSGGFGLQGMFKWSRQFNERWSGNAQLGLASKYFPSIVAQVGLTRTLKHDWEVEGHLGFRRVESAMREYRWNAAPEVGAWVFDRWTVNHIAMFNLGGGVTKNLDEFSLNGKLDLHYYDGTLSFSTQAKATYFPMETRWMSFWATAGVGNAPEASILDSALPNSLNKLNTNVGIGANYMLSSHLSFAVNGTWATFPLSVNFKQGTQEAPIQVVDTKYKNLFSVNASLLLLF